MASVDKEDGLLIARTKEFDFPEETGASYGRVGSTDACSYKRV